MNLSALSSSTSGGSAVAGSVTAAAGSGLGGFARLLTQFVGDANTHQAHAEKAVSNLASGHANNIHNVMLSMAKADLSFHLVLQLRDRLSDAYQEIMRMQI